MGRFRRNLRQLFAVPETKSSDEMHCLSVHGQRAAAGSADSFG